MTMQGTQELHSVSVERQVLSDGSIAWNVEQITEGGKIVLACVDKAHADALAVQLARCSWVEITGL